MQRHFTNREVRILTWSFVTGYYTATGVSMVVLFKQYKKTKKRIERFNTMAELINEFGEFLTEKGPMLSGEELLEGAVERLNFMGMASSQLLEDQKREDAEDK